MFFVQENDTRLDPMVGVVFGLAVTVDVISVTCARLC